MPRYFLSTEDGCRYDYEEGAELANHGTARVAAIRYAGDVMANEPGVLWDGRTFHVYVSDERAIALFTITCFATNPPAASGTK